ARRVGEDPPPVRGVQRLEPAAVVALAPDPARGTARAEAPAGARTRSRGRGVVERVVPPAVVVSHPVPNRSTVVRPACRSADAALTSCPAPGPVFPVGRRRAVRIDL